MKSLALLGVFLASGAVLSVHAIEKSAVTFRDISSDDAAKAAAAEHKIVLIDFYTTWCGPCKMLDAQTWTDAAVGKLVDESAVPLRLDAEHNGKTVADHYKIGAYPTILLLKPDGTEIDRLVGFRAAEVFISEFKSALAGSTALSRARKAVADTGQAIDHDRVEARHRLARELMQTGKYAEALSEYLWLYDVGMKEVESYVGVRNSFLTGEMGRLAEAYPLAKDELVKRRDAAAHTIQISTDRMAVTDFAALNEALNETDKTVTLYRELTKDDPRRQFLAYRVYRPLVKAQKYSEALGAHPFSEMTRQLDRSIDRLGQMPERIRTAARQGALAVACTDVEVLAGAGDLEHAGMLRDRLLALDGSDEMKATLRDRLTRAGHADLMPGAAN
jgi:thiol-disulfide isomerase/thioredoxin